MERDRYIYLTGLLPIVVTSILLFAWLLTGQPLLTWLGLLVSILAMLVVLYGFSKGIKFYNDTSVPAKQLKARRRHFIGHTAVLSLGLVFSFQGFQVFKANLAAVGQASGLEVLVKNTSDKPAKGLQIQAGTFNQTLPEIPARGQHSLRINLTLDTVLTARLGAGENVPFASIQVGPKDRSLLLRLDYQQNILPEIQ